MGIGFLNFKDKEKQIPQEFRKIAKDFSEKGFVTTSSENLIKSIIIIDTWDRQLFLVFFINVFLVHLAIIKKSN